MRGTATASFFLATTLVGLAIGPYMVGQISALTGSLRIGVLSLIGVAPISLALLIYAYRTLPLAEATMQQRALDAMGATKG
jgi:MFS-type transporter involved in bile tolerance (Atg22 family)